MGPGVAVVVLQKEASAARFTHDILGSLRHCKHGVGYGWARGTADRD
jgi:hypothetical protein